jgi:diacylglycerol kinase family enzyme
MLELVVVRRHDMAALLANAAHVFDGTLDRIPEVMTRRFTRMLLARPEPAPIQIDGELVDAGGEIEVTVMPKALKILVPAR